jgi:hypothetical protein
MIKTKDIEVKRTRDCPFRREGECDGVLIDTHYCVLTVKMTEIESTVICEDSFPNDCPLKTHNHNVWRSK